MTDKERLNKIVKKLGGRHVLAEKLGVTYGNIKNLLRSGREDIPNWGLALLALDEFNNKMLDKLVDETDLYETGEYAQGFERGVEELANKIKALQE